MPVTDDMALLLDRLHNDAATQEQFADDRQQAIAAYDLTSHERDAIVTGDCNDLVALGLATNTGALPDALGCPELVRPGLSGNLLDRIADALADALKPIRDRIPWPDRLPLPPFRGRPVPPRPPEPRPGPDPPGPTPGPDPPGPDRPRGGG